MVGAVVVAGGEIVGTAYHHRLGEAHAESLALAAAGDRARGATLYVSLEPCAHQGRTPPCIEGVLAAGIARVVMPAPDPDARVAGRGIHWLRERGVIVDVGCEANAAILDNHGYYHDRLGLGRTVTLKMATSRDGMVARGRGRRDRVTGDEAQLDVHRLRAVHDAVVIGAGTARVDRPRLDCRLLPDGVDREPVMVVFDTNASLATDASWPAPGREFVVVVREDVVDARVHTIEARGGRVLRCALDREHISVVDALDRLEGIGLTRILVEGGPALFASFVDAHAWDAMWHYQSADNFGAGGVPMADAGTFATLESSRSDIVDEIVLGGDARRRFARAKSWQRLLDRLSEQVEVAGRVHGNR
jgi:diaminohydroxyphosphoribosylaminopyrimidine deaminase/5-amino-6-(5-phosphoribosylamino)uracil reductase